MYDSNELSCQFPKYAAALDYKARHMSTMYYVAL